MAQQLIQNEKAKEVWQYLQEHKPGLEAMLPKHVTSDRLLRVAYNAIIRNKSLGGCTATSLQGAIIQASILGLEINSPLGECWLVPFKGKYGTVAQLIIDYRGLITLARRGSGVIVRATKHCENDDYAEFHGTNPRIEHTVNRGADRGEIVGYYATALYPDGRADFEYMNLKEIDEVKEMSKAKDRGPWVDWPEEMSKKTPIRRLLKRVDKSVELATAVQLDNQTAMGHSQDFSEAIAAAEGRDIIDIEATIPEDEAEPYEEITETQEREAGNGHEHTTDTPEQSSESPLLSGLGEASEPVQGRG